MHFLPDPSFWHYNLASEPAGLCRLLHTSCTSA